MWLCVIQVQTCDRHMTWDLGKLMELQIHKPHYLAKSHTLHPVTGSLAAGTGSWGTLLEASARNIHTLSWRVATWRDQKKATTSTYPQFSQARSLGSLWAGWLLPWLPVRQLLPLSPWTQEKAAMCDTGPNLRSTHDMGLGKLLKLQTLLTSLSNKAHFASCHWELGRWDRLLGHTLGGLKHATSTPRWLVATWKLKRSHEKRYAKLSVTSGDLLPSSGAAASTFSSDATLAWTREKIKQTWRKQLCGYVWYRSKPAIDTWHGTWASLWNFKSTNLTI